MTSPSPQKESPDCGGAVLKAPVQNTKAAPYRQAFLHSTAGFQEAMARAGLQTRDPIIADGKLRRFRVAGDKAGSKNGWYILYADGLAAGAFGSWKSGLKRTWCAKADRDMTQAEREDYRRRMEAARQAREATEQAGRKAAQDKAISIWCSAPPAPDDHPYLVKKRVRNHGLRLYKDTLLIPLCDGEGDIHSLQFIDSEGNKRFLSGGRKKGCFFGMGEVTQTICIAEGYATAASIFEATGHATAVAFDAGNLEPVARVMRAGFPSAKIIICADNDTQTEGNPGLTKAKAAAESIGACLAIPPCHGDFNDLLNGGAR